MPSAVSDHVEAYEVALLADPATDLADFLPPAGSPDYPAVLVELVRVALEHSYTRGRPVPLADYLARFPGAITGDGLRAVTFEEFRLRRLHGDAVATDTYHALYAVDVTGWSGLAADSAVWGPRTNALPPPPPAGAAPVPTQLADPGPEEAARHVRTAGAMPEPGDELLGLRIDEELGRGAFGRVYLARQNDLAGRPVAVKLAWNIKAESHTLAQLQHTNIVPVYSLHQAGPLQAVVMPYFGRTTLARVIQRVSGRDALPQSGRELLSTLDVRAEGTVADADPDADPAPPPAADAPAADGWTKLDGLSYVGAVLTLAADLADGLAHAHARGILHRDIKPANVLLTDEGRPMLLDFNLAEDTKLRGSPAGASMGGTLPYMSPEQLRAFARPGQPLDPRTDVYSLGVVLYEVLTGRHPFPAPKGAGKEAVTRLLADRADPPAVRPHNPAVSPATESIIRKCLAFDPADRYPSAAALRDDLRRQLADRPLQHTPETSLRERAGKWARRHPTLTSTTAVALAAGLLLAVAAGTAYAAVARSRALHARQLFADHAAAMQRLRLKAADPAGTRATAEAVTAAAGDVLARYGAADTGRWDVSAAAPLPPADRDRLAADLGEAFLMLAQADIRLARAGDADRGSAAAAHLATAERLAAGTLPRAVAQARADLQAARGEPADAVDGIAPGSARDRYFLAARLVQRGQARLGVDHLRAAVQADPHDAAAWFLCGAALIDAGQYEAAAGCFGTCTALLPGHAPAWLNRGIAYTRLYKFELAVSDFETAAALEPNRGRVYLERANALSQRQPAKAMADFDRACAAPDAVPVTFFRRASLRRRLGDFAGAVADAEEGFRRPATDPADWLARSEYRLAQAMAVRAAGGGPATGGLPDAALADVREALAMDPDHDRALQQAANVLSNWLGRDAEAVVALDRLVAARPQSAVALVNRAVLLGRAGDRAGAVRDAEAALLADPSPPIIYRTAGAFAQAGDNARAIAQLTSALRANVGTDLVDRDPDLDPLRDDPAFRRLVTRRTD